MLNITPALSPKGLLTVLISLLVSGEACAEAAGRVNFVIGNVSAVGTDGSSRSLSRGELINSGERLETGKGRLQIRFTDGSFVSLQPNTVFSVDNYSFAKNKPEEGSLLFNFIRGGMRTVSGAIGKVNRANYKVKTPVATIGIRGTGYAATQEPNGRLMLTVSKGIVNLSNDFGNSNVPAGQTFQTEQGKAPEQAPKGVSVAARADGPEAQGQGQSKDNDDNKTPLNLVGQHDDGFNPDFNSSEQVQGDGKPAFVHTPVFVQTVDGRPRLSSFGSLLLGTDEVQAYPGIIALFDDLSADGKTVGNLIGLADVKGTVLFDGANSSSPLHFANVKQVGSLSFGEWTNGNAIVNDRLQTGGLSLSNTQFIPYIVGTTAEKALNNNMKVTYSLVDATPARSGNKVGTLSSLNITIDLAFEPLVDVSLVANMNKIDYSASVQKRSLGVTFDALSGFIINDDFYATSSDNNGVCANNGCPVNLSAFFSGNSDMGVVYKINRPTNFLPISGVAVLGGGTDTAIISDIPLVDRVDSNLANNFTALFESNTDLSTQTATNLGVIFDSKTGGWRTGFQTTAVDNELTDVAHYGVQDIQDPNTGARTNAATISDITHHNKVLSWGTWANGNVVLNDTDNALLTGAYVHYLVGLQTPVLPTSGVATYSYVGGLSSDSTTSVSGNMNVDFGNAASGLGLALNFTQGNNTLTMTGTTALSPSFTFTSLNTSLNNATAAACATCEASGFFAGNNAEMIGLKYKAALDATSGITGVGGFNRNIPGG